MKDINETLAERGERYGSFADHARVTQVLKRMASSRYRSIPFTDTQAEAMDMIMHKIGRILCGDPNYADSWVDIAGYATLVVKELEE